MLICLGLGRLLYVGMRKFAGQSELLTPKRFENSFELDAASFNLSLEDPQGSDCPDPELRAFVLETLDTSIKGNEMPFNEQLFIEAIDRSQFNTRPLGLVDRVSLRRWLNQYMPIPYEGSEYYRVLNIRLDKDPTFAVADIIYYSETLQYSGSGRKRVASGPFMIGSDWNMEFAFRINTQLICAARRGQQIVTTLFPA